MDFLTWNYLSQISSTKWGPFVDRHVAVVQFMNCPIYNPSLFPYVSHKSVSFPMQYAWACLLLKHVLDTCWRSQYNIVYFNIYPKQKYTIKIVVTAVPQTTWASWCYHIGCCTNIPYFNCCS